MLFGLGPAWQSTRASLVQAITSESRSTTQSGTLRSLLVVAEVATAVLVLSGAGLLLRAWISLDGVDPGYRAPEALTMALSLPMVAAHWRAKPIRHAGRAAAVLRGGAARNRNRTGRPQCSVGRRTAARRHRLHATLHGRRRRDVSGPRQVFASYHMVSPTYFETMSISGRPLVGPSPTSDGGDGAPVCIVSEAFVR